MRNYVILTGALFTITLLAPCKTEALESVYVRLEMPEIDKSKFRSDSNQYIEAAKLKSDSGTKSVQIIEKSTNNTFYLGTPGDDIIETDSNMMFAMGQNGSDYYGITSSSSKIWINNYATDGKVDTLNVWHCDSLHLHNESDHFDISKSEFDLTFSCQTTDFDSKNISVVIINYFQNAIHRHLLFKSGYHFYVYVLREWDRHYDHYPENFYRFLNYNEDSQYMLRQTEILLWSNSSLPILGVDDLYTNRLNVNINRDTGEAVLNIEKNFELRYPSVKLMDFIERDSVDGDDFKIQRQWTDKYFIFVNTNSLERINVIYVHELGFGHLRNSIPLDSIGVF